MIPPIWDDADTLCGWYVNNNIGALPQVFRNNMTVKEEPKITACKSVDNWTSITFKPDLAKFGMTHLESDTVQLMHKRAYDLAGVLGKTCKVTSDAVLCSTPPPSHVFQTAVE